VPSFRRGLRGHGSSSPPREPTPPAGRHQHRLRPLCSTRACARGESACRLRGPPRPRARPLARRVL
jgi:hypothetical protein